MCGIFGYVGKQNASKLIIKGLKRLEYRGYDSWGIAVVAAKPGVKGFKLVKQVGPIGKVNQLNLPVSHVGIGHTRWATHGGVTRANAHPYEASDQSFVLAQNGIVENYQQLKAKLTRQGFSFRTETDTEVIVRLIEAKKQQGLSLKEAVRQAFLELEGRNTIVAMSTQGDQVVAVRFGSPLVVGVTEDESFFASDSLSFADQTDKAILIKDHQLFHYANGKRQLFEVESGQKAPVKITKLSHAEVTVDKQGYSHFMIKEIIEQQHTIREAVQYSFTQLKPLIKALKQAQRVFTVGAGTASFAAGQVAYYLRQVGEIPAIELKSYEIDSWLSVMGKDDLLLAISQSGETADTLEAVEKAKSRGAKIAGLVNMAGSTLPQLADWTFYTRSGPEICVASTKAFTAQISWGLLVASAVAGRPDKAKKSLKKLSQYLAGYFKKQRLAKMRKLALKFTNQEHFFILGKGQHYYIGLEAALKIKEISYKHFEGFAAGELKHGVIALVERGTPVLAIIGEDETQNEMLSAAAEVKSRGAFLVGVSSQDNSLFDEWLEISNDQQTSAIGAIIPFQLLAYFLGVSLGCDPDRPRNLAKSVTVK